MDVICVLPARLSSTRIPRKPLQLLAGKPLLEWSWRTAREVSAFDRVVIATDSGEVGSVGREFGAEVVMTAAEHPCGTDRVNEAAMTLEADDDDVIVNFQADEPFVDADTVDGAVRALTGGENTDIATLAAPIRDDEEWTSPGIVKIARASDGRALYFSRSSIPHPRDGVPRWDAGASGGAAAVPDGRSARGLFLRHIGIYACRRATLRAWAGLAPSPLERVEKLEQLRALEAGMRIHVEVGPWTEPGIDLPADLERAERVLSGVDRARGA